MFESEPPTRLELFHLINAAADFQCRANSQDYYSVLRLALYRIAYVGWREIEDILACPYEGKTHNEARGFRSAIISDRKRCSRAAENICRDLKIPIDSSFELPYARSAWHYWKYVHADIAVIGENGLADERLCWSFLRSVMENTPNPSIFTKADTKIDARRFADNLIALLREYTSISEIGRSEFVQ